MSFRVDIEASGMDAAFSAFESFAEVRMQKAMLAATARAAQRLKSRVRQDMAAAGLGRLGNALDATSDQRRGLGVHPQADGGFSASGLLYARTRSARTLGALAAYTEGASIAPRRGRFLWIPTDDVPRLASDKTRLTPEKWTSSGLDKRIGPLVMVRGVNGLPLLVVKNASVSLSGKSRSAKSLTKTGKLKKGQVAREFLVAFIAIPSTVRAARIDIRALHAQVMAELPDLLAAELRRA